MQNQESASERFHNTSENEKVPSNLSLLQIKFYLKYIKYFKYQSELFQQNFSIII